ncbi:hypothetical protein KEM52_004345, partial [Ascosphaera acerosa]
PSEGLLGAISLAAARRIPGAGGVGRFSADAAIPGLDINPPSLGTSPSRLSYTGSGGGDKRRNSQSQGLLSGLQGERAGSLGSGRYSTDNEDGDESGDGGRGEGLGGWISNIVRGQRRYRYRSKLSDTPPG